MSTGLSPAINRLGTETAFSVLARAKELERAGRPVIHLEIGEPDFETPPHVVQAAVEGLAAGMTHYCPSAGIDGLREAAAGYFSRTRGLEITAERWNNIFTLNMTSAMLCSQAVVPSMVERKRGTIINIVSIAGRNGGGPGAGAYAAAKAALISFTKSMAKELAPQGIRVNAVSPGVIDTPFHEVFSTPEMIRGFVSQIPMGRTGRSEECATAIAFLASAAAAYITGQTLEVNGGQLML